VTIDMTSMMDVVFIMLIFFIATTSFVKESGINVNQPAAASTERQDRGNITIAVSETGAYRERGWLGQRCQGGGGGTPAGHLRPGVGTRLEPLEIPPQTRDGKPVPALATLVIRFNLGG